MGIEPTSVGATIRCVNHFATTAINITFQISIINGAGEGTRTPTPKAPDPKSGASANSATPAANANFTITYMLHALHQHIIYYGGGGRIRTAEP